VTIAWPTRTVTVAHVGAVEIRLNWRWAPVLVLGTWLLARNVLPASFPAWAVGTTWLTSAAVVLAGEIALLLHELSHAVAAHGRGQEVTHIVFHGFRAETVVSPGLPAPAQEALIALVGPAMNMTLAALAALARVGLATHGPIDVLLLSLVLGNAAMAMLSLVPLGGSDGQRALNAFYRARLARSAAWLP
jgi:Zn-dependent protease